MPGSLLITALMSLAVAPEVVAIVAGNTIRTSSVNAMAVALSMTAGGSLGSTLIFLAARWIGRSRLEAFLARCGRWRPISRKDLEQSEYFYRRYGWISIFIGRWLPAVRSLVSIPAGLHHMPFRQFLWPTILGTLTWNLLLTGLVYSVGLCLSRLEKGFAIYANLTLLVIIMVTIYLALRCLTKKRFFKKTE